MSKLPFMQFYPADWLQDTRTLSLEARGAWIDLLCAMWIAPERGRLLWTLDQFHNFLGFNHSIEAVELVNELVDSGVGSVEIDEVKRSVTVMSRRMMREEIQRNQGRERVKRFRNADVTQMKRRIYQKSEVRSHISEEDTHVNLARLTSFAEDWNRDFADRLATIRLPLSDSRKRKLRLRLQEHPEEDFWDTVFTNIGQSKFLIGNGSQGWKCTFDFLIENDTNCVKIAEGQYAERKSS